MAIVAQPTGNYLSTYRPLMWELEFVSPGEFENVCVDVYWNNNLVQSFRKSWYSKVDNGMGQFVYSWRVDVQSIGQRNLDPLGNSKSLIFGDLNNSYVGYGNQMGRVRLEFSYEFVDLDGLLKKSGTVDVGNSYFVVNSIREHEDEMCMDDYIGDWITDMPDCIDICEGENMFLTGWGVLGTSGTRIKVVDKGGGVSESVIPSLVVLGNSLSFSVGVGPANLLSQGIVIDSNNVDYYEVDFGGNLLGGFVGSSRKIKFKVVECCDGRVMRLHWMNSLGGGDSYSFRCKKIKKSKSKAELVEKALVWDIRQGTKGAHNVEQRGVSKVCVDSNERYVIESKILDNEVKEWLRGIDKSLEVYLEVEGYDKLIPMVVVDVDDDVYSSEEFGLVKVLEVEYANKDFSHIW